MYWVVQGTLHTLSHFINLIIISTNYSYFKNKNYLKRMKIWFHIKTFRQTYHQISRWLKEALKAF